MHNNSCYMCPDVHAQLCGIRALATHKQTLAHMLTITRPCNFIVLHAMYTTILVAAYIGVPRKQSAGALPNIGHMPTILLAKSMLT